MRRAAAVNQPTRVLEHVSGQRRVSRVDSPLGQRHGVPPGPGQLIGAGGVEEHGAIPWRLLERGLDLLIGPLVLAELGQSQTPGGSR